MKTKTRTFTRAGQKYTARYNKDGKLVRLVNETSGQDIPQNTQPFRLLADNNRGGKFIIIR